jgi:hypothetical protein
MICSGPWEDRNQDRLKQQSKLILITDPRRYVVRITKFCDLSALSFDPYWSLAAASVRYLKQARTEACL